MLYIEEEESDPGEKWQMLGPSTLKAGEQRRRHIHTLAHTHVQTQIQGNIRSL